MLALGESHTPGTFVAFLLLQSGALLNSGLMFRSEHFARATAVTGLLGGALLLTFEIVSDFIPALFAMSLFIAMAGGLLSLVWYVLVGRDLLRLAAEVRDEAGPVAGRMSPAQAPNPGDLRQPKGPTLTWAA